MNRCHALTVVALVSLASVARADDPSADGPYGVRSVKLDVSRLGLVGHSFGGAAVVWEAASDPRVKCVVGLAPVNQANRAKLMENAGSVTAPLLVVAGDFDWLATNKTYTRAIYDRATRSA